MIILQCFKPKQVDIKDEEKPLLPCIYFSTPKTHRSRPATPLKQRISASLLRAHIDNRHHPNPL
jgi:hypothetical protein